MEACVGGMPGGGEIDGGDGRIKRMSNWSNWTEPMVEASSEVETTHKFPTVFLAILG